MAAPTLVASYFLQSTTSSSDSSTLVTSSFTPSNGEVIVVKAATWDKTVTSGTPSGGSLTYTQRAVTSSGSFACYGTIFTAVVSGSPGSMAVTLSAPSAGCYHSMTVERWSGAQLAGSPAVSSPVDYAGTASAPSATITTTAANSIVTWVNADDASKDPTAGHAYLSGATEDGLADGHSDGSSVHYYAYQTAASAGSQTIGMSTPLSQKWVMVGIEVQAAASFAPARSSAFMTFFQ